MALFVTVPLPIQETPASLPTIRNIAYTPWTTRVRANELHEGSTSALLFLSAGGE